MSANAPSTSNGPTNGTTGQSIAYNLPEWMALAAFMGIAWFNVLELNISIFMTFKRRRGLYFWSLLISSWGIIFHSLGFLLKLWQITPNNYLSCTFITIGWWPMVTGQALVLYSRLHLVVKERSILRGVLIMIIWNAVTLHIPTTILTYASSSPDWATFVTAFDVMERLQMTIFCIQEFIISGIYLWATKRLLRPVYRGRTRSVMMQLIWINVIIVLMDIAMLAEEYQNAYGVEATLKSMVYSIKLTLEFAVLNQLMRLANSSTSPANLVSDDEENRRHSARKESIKNATLKPLHQLRRIIPGWTSSQDEKPTSQRNSTTRPPNSSTSLRLPLSRNATQRPYSLADVEFGEKRDPSALGSILSERLAEGRDIAEERQRSGSVATIYNNPAAFFENKRHRPRDPLDPLSAINSPAGTPVERSSVIIKPSNSRTHSYFSNVKYDDSQNTANYKAPDTEPSPTSVPPSPTELGPSQPPSPKIPISRSTTVNSSNLTRPATFCAPDSQSPEETKEINERRARFSFPRSKSLRNSRPFSSLTNFSYLSNSSKPSTTYGSELPPPPPEPASHAPDPELLRPSRPSVSDWASTPSEASDDSHARLASFERAARSLQTRSRAVMANEVIRQWDERTRNEEEAEAGRSGEGRGNGMGWVTSAL